MTGTTGGGPRVLLSPNGDGGRLALCLPPVLVWSFDCALTLSGQSEADWVGSRAPDIEGTAPLHSYPARVNEVNPASRSLLTWHPLAYIAETVLLMLMLCSLILFFPSSLALRTCLAATIGHTWGATTWITRFQYGFQIGNGFVLFVAVLLALGPQTWYARGQPEPLLVPRMSPTLRWVLIGVFSVAFVYLGVWPRVG